MVEMRTYSWGNYSEWRIKALEERRDFYQDILDYDDEASDDFRRELKTDRKKINEWLRELRKHKKDVNKDPEVVKWKIETMDQIKKDLEANINGGYLDEETKEMYEEELGYAKRYLDELKK